MLKKVLLPAVFLGIMLFQSARPEVVAAERAQEPQAHAEKSQHYSDDLARTGIVPYRVAPPDTLLITSPNAEKAPSGVEGEYLVGPDGTIVLGSIGRVSVDGKTITEIQKAIDSKLGKARKVNVFVFQHNSNCYYIITKDATSSENVVCIPCSGNETILDAIAHIGGPSQIWDKLIWVSRPDPNGDGHQILTVDSESLVHGAKTAINYKLLPGDRVFVWDARPGNSPQASEKVKLHFRIVHDWHGSLSEFAALRNGAVMQTETKHALATLRILSRHNLIGTVAARSIMCNSRVKAHFAIESSSLQESKYIKGIAIQATPVIRDKSNVMLTTEVELRSARGILGVDTSHLIHEGTTVIMRAHPFPQQKNEEGKSDAVYVIVTPELVR